MLGGLVVPGEPQRRSGRLDRGDERRLASAGAERMVGDLGGRSATVAGGQGFEVGGVDPAALARQEVVTDRFAEQGMTELVRLVAAAGQHLVIDRRPQGVVQLLLRQTDHLGEDGVVVTTIGARRRTDQPAGVVVQPIEPHEQQVGERLGQGGVGVGEAGIEQLLGEERVARGPAHDGEQALVAQLVGSLAADERDDIGVGERLELDAAHTGQPHPFGERLAQGMASVEIVGAVADHDVHRAAEAAGQHEADQVAGRRIRPVRVLDHEQQRTRRREDLQRSDDGGEQLGALDAVRGRRRRQQWTERRQPGRELGALVLVERTERLGERLVRRGTVAEVEAVARQHVVPGDAGAGAELAQEAGLADPGVAADQDELAEAPSLTPAASRSCASSRRRPTSGIAVVRSWAIRP